jgi:hypothetical protein
VKLLKMAYIGLCGAVGLAAFLTASGCTQQADESTAERTAESAADRQVAGATDATDATARWVKVAPDQMTAAQKNQRTAMLSAVDALGGELMGELSAALAAGDPGAAIGVCRVKAPAVAAKVSHERGLEIGRTSYRLRNPANLPPAWAAAAVAERVAEPTYLAGPHGELGGLLPIRLKAGCLMCHGPADQIDATVRAALAADYPGDQAVGFAEGDLRGWFWVKAPAAAASGT